VRRTESFYVKQGVRSLLLAKFVPGLNAVSSPLAGITHMKPAKFLFWDVMGSLLWAGALLGTGYIFSGQIEAVAKNIRAMGILGTLPAVGLTTYILYKAFARRRFLKQFRIARITAEELKRKLDQGETPVILDLRDARDYTAEPATIPGAVHVDASEIGARSDHFPGGSEVILYCS